MEFPDIMRSIPFVLLLLALALETEAQKNVVKTRVFSPLVGQYQLVYERVVFPNLSFQMSAGITVRSPDKSRRSEQNGKIYTIELMKETGFVLRPEVRYYFKGQAPERTFIGGFARFRQKNKRYEDTSKDNNGTQGIDQDLSYVHRQNISEFGVLLGYQWLLNSKWISKRSNGRLSLEIFAGPTLKLADIENIYDTEALNKAPKRLSLFYEKVGDRLYDKKFSNFLPLPLGFPFVSFPFVSIEGYSFGVHAGFHISYAF